MAGSPFGERFAAAFCRNATASGSDGTTGSDAGLEPSSDAGLDAGAESGRDAAPAPSDWGIPRCSARAAAENIKTNFGK